MNCTRKAFSFLGALAVVALVTASASAQYSYQTVAYEDNSAANEVSQLRAEVAALENQIDAGVHGGYEIGGCGGCGGCGYYDGGCGCGQCGCGGGCDQGCGCAQPCNGAGNSNDCNWCCQPDEQSLSALSPKFCCCCDPCCRSQGVTYGATLSFLKVHNSTGTGQRLFGNAGNGGPVSRVANLDTEFDPAFGAWVGFQRADGFGFRATYWDFDQDYTANTLGGFPAVPNGTVNQGWDIYSLGFATTDSSKIGCNWDMTLGVGFKWVEYREHLTLFGLNGAPELQRHESTFTGYGMESFMEFRRQLTCNIGMFSSFGFSVLMGDDNQLFAAGGVAATVIDNQLNDVKFIYEAKGGIEYILPICAGGYYFVRAGGEVQYWDGFGINRLIGTVVAAAPNTSTGFGGFFFSAGIQR